MRVCQSQVRAHARQLDDTTARRLDALLGTVERLSKGLAGWRGRKSIVIFSEGFIQSVHARAFASAVDASRRANTAVYCVDARGLSITTSYSADLGSSAAPVPGDVGAAMASALAATSGGELLADATGGLSLTDNNDLLAGLERVTDESSAYYLLGFQPETPRDGKWHPLEVKVSLPQVKLRARRGYLATPTAGLLALVNARLERAGRTRSGGRPTDPALLATGTESAIPLRIAPHVMGPDGSGAVRVLVALEIDSRRLDFGAVPKGDALLRATALDLGLIAVSRDQPKVVALDERLYPAVEPKAANGWWILAREVSLPPGVAQVRAAVRDVSTLLAGSATLRLEIPPLDTPRIGATILTDRALDATDGAQAPRPVPVAHRTFAEQSLLYCQYEVFGLAGAAAEGLPQVAAGYTVTNGDGQVLREQKPSPIAVDANGRVRRLVSFPLAGLAPGRYELTLEAVDLASQRTLTQREPFAVVSAPLD
jgi:hypothetical protein